MMDDSLHYLAINRQRGLRSEMNAIANNIANLDTPGFRREGMVFSEFVVASADNHSLSMADLGVRYVSDVPAELAVTAGELDIAILGEGYFAVGGDDAPTLTRAGSFGRAADGTLVTIDGRSVLDIGEAPILLPPAGSVSIAVDGSISVDGVEIAQVGIFLPAGPWLDRRGDTRFSAPEGLLPVVEPRLQQGAIERANVDAVIEIARMISVSRGYEQVQTLIRDDDDRVREVIRTLGQPI